MNATEETGQSPCRDRNDAARYRSWDLACAVVDAFVDAGVRHVVACPGSRNAALLVALADAEAAGALHLHVRIDERVAGFTALGIAKATGRPVPVVTTSGTAVGNLVPSMMEAWHSRVPVVAVTADRPHSLIGSGSNQTTMQLPLFQAHTVAREDIPVDQPVNQLRRRVARLLAGVSGVRTNGAGPGHLNLHLDGMLAVRPGQRWQPRGQVPTVQIDPIPGATAIATQPSVAHAEAGDASFSHIARCHTGFHLGARPVLLVADNAGFGLEAVSWAQQVGVPVCAEPSSGARSGRTIAHYRTLLAHFADQIDQVIVVGHPTLSRPVTQLLSRDDIDIVAWTQSATWDDPTWALTRVVTQMPDPQTLAGRVDAEWLAQWRAADETACAQANERYSSLSARPDRPLTGSVVAATLVRHCGDQPVMIGPSQAIRHLDLAPMPADAKALNGWANRGLAGIDGIFSTAIGLEIGLSCPVTVLCGDLTFRHDAAALAVTEGERVPDLRIIVLDDDGGSIFSTLESGAPEVADRYQRVFATPQRPDIADIAAGYGVNVISVATVTELDRVVSQPVQRGAGIEVVVARICPPLRGTDGFFIAS